MDYKAEADRIKKLFWPFVEHTTGDKHDAELENENSKACAAICVKEIIKALHALEVINYKKVLEHINSNQ